MTRMQGATSRAGIITATSTAPIEQKVFHCEDLAGHISHFLPIANRRSMMRVSLICYRIFGRAVARNALSRTRDVSTRQQELRQHAEKHLHLHAGASGARSAANPLLRLMEATQSNVFALCDELQGESARLQNQIRSLQQQFWHACRQPGAAWQKAGFGTNGINGSGRAPHRESRLRSRLWTPLAASMAIAPTEKGPSLVMLALMLFDACRQSYPLFLPIESIRQMNPDVRHGIAPLPTYPDLAFIEQLIEHALVRPQPDGIWAFDTNQPSQVPSVSRQVQEDELLRYLVIKRLAPEMRRLEACTGLRVAKMFEAPLKTAADTVKLYPLWRAMPAHINEVHAERCLHEALRRNDWFMIDVVLQRSPRLFWGRYRDSLVVAMLEAAHNPLSTADRKSVLDIFGRMHAHKERPSDAHALARPLHAHCLAYQRPAVGDDPIPLLGEMDRQAHAITLGLEAVWDQPAFDQRARALVSQVLGTAIQIAEPLLLAAICRLDHAGYYERAVNAGLLKAREYTIPYHARQPHAWETDRTDLTPLHTILRFDAPTVLQSYAFELDTSLRSLRIEQYGQPMPLALIAKMFDATKINAYLSEQGVPAHFRNDRAIIAFLRALAVDRPDLISKVMPMVELKHARKHVIPLLRERQPWANTLATRYFQSLTTADYRAVDVHDFLRPCLHEILTQDLRSEQGGALFTSIRRAVYGAAMPLTPKSRETFIRICRRHNHFESLPHVLGLPYVSHSRSHHDHLPLSSAEKTDLLRLCQSRSARQTQQRYQRIQGFLRDAGVNIEVRELNQYCLQHLKAEQQAAALAQKKSALHAASKGSGSHRSSVIALMHEVGRVATAAADVRLTPPDLANIMRDLAPLLIEQEAQYSRVNARLATLLEKILASTGSFDRQAASADLRTALVDARQECIRPPAGKLFHAICILDDGALYASLATDHNLDVQSLFEFTDPDSPAEYLRHPFNMLIAHGARNVFLEIARQRSTLPGKWIEDAIPWISAALKAGGKDGEFILQRTFHHLTGMSFIRVLQRIVDTCPNRFCNERDPVHQAIKGCPQHFSGQLQTQRILMIAQRARMARHVDVEALLRKMAMS